MYMYICVCIKKALYRIENRSVPVACLLFVIVELRPKFLVTENIVKNKGEEKSESGMLEKQNTKNR